jgi:polyferredoxin
MKSSVLFRRFSQLFFFLLFIYILWSTTYPLRGGISPSAFFVCDPLLMISIAISERVFVSGILTGVLMLVLTFILGRFFCGWICPLGSMIDCAGSLKRTKKNEIRSPARKIRMVKFAVLLIGFVLAVVGVQVFWLLDPIVIMGRFVSLNFIPLTTIFINNIFVSLIQRFELYGAFYDVYRSLKMGILGVSVHFFAHSWFIAVFMMLILASTFIKKRLWCRMICPLGALYALVARFALLRRVVQGTCVHCHHCQDICRMDAIHEDTNYDAGECILCMDCVVVCPPHGTTFTWAAREQHARSGLNEKGAISRRHFLAVLGASILTLVAAAVVGKRTQASVANVIRPPGSLKEPAFLNRCVRCGNCMKVCPTNGLQPVLLETGFSGLWTPRLVPEIGYCEYNCNLCGTVCPTGAIANVPLERKKKMRLGRAEIDRTRCVAWAANMQCLVCEEHCPIPDKAIKTVAGEVNGRIVLKPVVDAALCIGCGICQSVCPARPERAIVVNPAFSDRL